MSVRQETRLAGHSCLVHLINGVYLEIMQGMYDEMLPNSDTVLLLLG